MSFLGQSTDRYSSTPLRDPEDDTLRLECGVFGVFGVRDAAAIPQDRHVDPERLRQMCAAALGQVLD